MNNEKNIVNLRNAIGYTNEILIINYLLVQVATFGTIFNVVFCICILMLITIDLIFNQILKDSKRSLACGVCLIVWLFNLIINLSSI